MYNLLFIFHSYNKAKISTILASQLTAFTDSGTLEKDCDGLFYYEDPNDYEIKK